MQIEEVLDKLKELKKELANVSQNKTNSAPVDITKLKDVSEDLKILLIQLHSNYDTEIKSIRSNAELIIYKIIDETELALRAMDARVKEHEIKLGIEEKMAKKTKFNIANLYVLVIGFIFLFTFAWINPDAFDRTVGAIPKLFGFTGLGNPAHIQESVSSPSEEHEVIE